MRCFRSQVTKAPHPTKIKKTCTSTCDQTGVFHKGYERLKLRSVAWPILVRTQYIHQTLGCDNEHHSPPGGPLRFGGVET